MKKKEGKSMKCIKFVACIMGILFSALIYSSPSSAKEEYPTRPITLLVGMAPGGLFDVQGRLLAEIVEKYLGKPVLVNNMPGANGGLMMDFLSRQKPDGYTIAIGGGSYITMNRFIERTSYSYKDFTYIRAYCKHPQNLSVRNDAPWKTFDEFVEYSKKNAGKVRYASWAPTSTVSLQMRIISKQRQVDWIHIPYKGDAPAITAILGGHVEAVGLSATVVPYAKSGHLRVLVTFLQNRWREFPDVPTVKELGYDVPPLTDWTSISGIVAPKGLSGAPFEKLESAFSKAFEDPAFVKLMQQYYVPRLNLGPKEYEKVIEEADSKLEKIMPPLLEEIQK